MCGEAGVQERVELVLTAGMTAPPDRCRAGHGALGGARETAYSLVVVRGGHGSRRSRATLVLLAPSRLTLAALHALAWTEEAHTRCASLDTDKSNARVSHFGCDCTVCDVELCVVCGVSTVRGNAVID